MEKEKAAGAIKALERAAKVEILVAGLEENQFCGAMRELAEAIQKHYGLDGSAMERYDAEIQEANGAAETPDAEVSLQDVECLNEVVLDLCGSLEDPKQIVCNMRLVRDVMYLWSPMCGKV